MIYGLTAFKKGGKYLIPHETSYTDECAESLCSLWLKDEIIKDENGDLHHYYRLHAVKPHNIEMALAYDIQCPRCTHGLKQIGRCLNSHELGLYSCPVCENELNRRKR